MYMGRQALCKGVGRPALWKWICAYKPFAYVNGHTSSLQIYMGRQAICKSIWADKPFANLYGHSSHLQMLQHTRSTLYENTQRSLRATTKGTLERTPKRTSKRTSGENSRENTYSTGGVHPSHTLRCAIAIFELHELHWSWNRDLDVLYYCAHRQGWVKISKSSFLVFSISKYSYRIWWWLDL